MVLDVLDSIAISRGQPVLDTVLRVQSIFVLTVAGLRRAEFTGVKRLSVCM